MAQPATIILRHGEILHLHARRGTHIVAVRGTLAVTGPAEWLAGHVVMPHFTLHEGEAHIIPHSAMLALEGRGNTEIGCEIRCIPAQPRLPLARWAASLAGAIRRFAAASYRHA